MAAMMIADRHHVAGVDPSSVGREYERRGIADWADRRLVEAVAGVIAEPRQRPANSFVLHAPLELAARAALLPDVVGERERAQARIHILAIAAQYEAFDAPAGTGPEPAVEPGGGGDPVAALTGAIAAGDLARTDLAARALAAAVPPDRLVRGLADDLVPRTAAAAHAPIFLFQLSRLPASTTYRGLLRPLARELAREPDWRIRWIDEWVPPVRSDASELARRLAASPRLGVPGSTFVHPTMMQVDGPVARDLLADPIGSDAGGPETGPSVAAAILRVAARSMLVEGSEHVPYGWTHCLTMPHAVLRVAPSTCRPAQAIAIAATHVVGFRAALASGDVPHDATHDRELVGRHNDQPRAAHVERLATAASQHPDAHVVKYVDACLDAAAWDRAASALYLAAADRLLAWWHAAVA
jgi:hypothetical protein